MLAGTSSQGLLGGSRRRDGRHRAAQHTQPRRHNKPAAHGDQLAQGGRAKGQPGQQADQRPRIGANDLGEVDRARARGRSRRRQARKPTEDASQKAPRASLDTDGRRGARTRSGGPAAALMAGRALSRNSGTSRAGEDQGVQKVGRGRRPGQQREHPADRRSGRNSSGGGQEGKPRGPLGTAGAAAHAGQPNWRRWRAPPQRPAGPGRREHSRTVREAKTAPPASPTSTARNEGGPAADVVGPVPGEHEGGHKRQDVGGEGHRDVQGGDPKPAPAAGGTAGVARFAPTSSVKITTPAITSRAVTDASQPQRSAAGRIRSSLKTVMSVPLQESAVNAPCGAARAGRD